MTSQAQSGQPTVFHITHWKAGSQWVRGVLTQAQPHRIVTLKNDMSHVTADPIVEGGMYTPVYLKRPVFDKAVNAAIDKRIFVIIRDLRDTLISWYFSLKISHGVGFGRVAEFRKNLTEMDLEDGLAYLINGKLVGIARIQKTWRTSGHLILRYEDLLADEQAVFKTIFEHCKIDVSDSEREAIVHKNSFERRSGGRKRGEEDITSHYRKAIVGDWKNYFTPATTQLFKDKFGQVLIDTGYESSFDW